MFETDTKNDKFAGQSSFRTAQPLSKRYAAISVLLRLIGIFLSLLKLEAKNYLFIHAESRLFLQKHRTKAQSLKKKRKRNGDTKGKLARPLFELENSAV